jgi:hypothetical protein
MIGKRPASAGATRLNRSFAGRRCIFSVTAHWCATLHLDEARDVTVRLRAIGRTDFRRLELVRDGQVVATAASRANGGHFSAEMERQVSIDKSSWLAVRTPPPPAPGHDAAATDSPANEYGGQLFSHTSPIYVRVSDRDVFDPEVALGLLDEMQSDWQQIEKQAVFANDEEREQVKRVYDDAIERLESRLREQAK